MGVYANFSPRGSLKNRVIGIYQPKRVQNGAVEAGSVKQESIRPDSASQNDASHLAVTEGKA